MTAKAPEPFQTAQDPSETAGMLDFGEFKFTEPDHKVVLDDRTATADKVVTVVDGPL